MEITQEITIRVGYNRTLEEAAEEALTVSEKNPDSTVILRSNGGAIHAKLNGGRARCFTRPAVRIFSL